MEERMANSGQRFVGVAFTSLLVVLTVWTSPPESRAITFTLIQPGTNTFLGSDGSTSGWYTSPADSAIDNKWSFIGVDLLAYPRTENAPDLLSILRGLDPTHRYDVYFQ